MMRRMKKYRRGGWKERLGKVGQRWARNDEVGQGWPRLEGQAFARKNQGKDKSDDRYLLLSNVYISYFPRLLRFQKKYLIPRV